VKSLQARKGNTAMINAGMSITRYAKENNTDWTIILRVEVAPFVTKSLNQIEREL